jgi:ATP-dependent exoDNAse (exonuclease V) beta subunit
LNNLPGTIDLLEIKADGSFVIHDYKTINSFKNKDKTADLSDEQIFLNRGYVAQLMIYGKILEEYGLIPAEKQFNLIATQVTYTSKWICNRRGSHKRATYFYFFKRK